MLTRSLNGTRPSLFAQIRSVLPAQRGAHRSRDNSVLAFAKRLVSAAIVTAATTAHAQLEWDATQHAIEPTGQRWIEAEFICRNTGTYPLTVVKIETANRRLTTDWRGSSRTLQPGASGVLGVKYRNSGIVDVTDAVVSVRTDENGAPPTPLTLSLLPKGETQRRAEAKRLKAVREAWKPSFTVSPQVLRWTIGEQALPQVVDIKAVDGVVLPEALQWYSPRLRARQPGDKRFEHAVEVVEPGRHLRVTVTPKSTERSIRTRWGVTGWSPAAVEADPLLADRGLQWRHGLRLEVAPQVKATDRASSPGVAE